MVDIASAYSAIKETLGLLKKINETKSDFEIKVATSAIQDKLISVQGACFALDDIIHSRDAEIVHLKAKIAEFEDFRSQAEGYELNQLDSGTFVYSKKQPVGDSEAIVYLCPNCFCRRVISILQPVPVSENVIFHKSRCLQCENHFLMNKNQDYVPPQALEELGRKLSSNP
ncbi:hypothetical protein GTGU_01251 [Trabulsiella guamensis ATCC 49490]|uniref:Uncharacterized protein n=1 Tax=Trabulsiella guamensis ATCC 49490 TaxID=1005994 RepID=A0A085AF39_9ENTR|nr:hypothetical protein [Trabulsiella guamensis]KFC08834.1 hypothetical protein GTGU_01251 [Trabulsiella guamensis ATCC 49490]